jgi:hypothetical protein
VDGIALRRRADGVQIARGLEAEDDEVLSRGVDPPQREGPPRLTGWFAAFRFSFLEPGAYQIADSTLALNPAPRTSPSRRNQRADTLPSAPSPTARSRCCWSSRTCITASDWRIESTCWKTAGWSAPGPRRAPTSVPAAAPRSDDHLPLRSIVTLA